MLLKIEKGVPIPDRFGTGELKEQIKDLVVGDSFVVPTVSFRTRIKELLELQGIKMTSRVTEKDGSQYRVWITEVPVGASNGTKPHHVNGASTLTVPVVPKPEIPIVSEPDKPVPIMIPEKKKVGRPRKIALVIDDEKAIPEPVLEPEPIPEPEPKLLQPLKFRSMAVLNAYEEAERETKSTSAPVEDDEEDASDLPGLFTKDTPANLESKLELGIIEQTEYDLRLELINAREDPEWSKEIMRDIAILRGEL